VTSGHGQLKLEEKKENKIKKIKVKGTSRSRRTGSGPDSVRHYHLARSPLYQNCKHLGSRRTGSQADGLDAWAADVWITSTWAGSLGHTI